MSPEEDIILPINYYCNTGVWCNDLCVALFIHVDCCLCRSGAGCVVSAVDMRLMSTDKVVCYDVPCHI